MTATEKITARMTADIVLFALQEGHMHVLLIERAKAPFLGQWALPGGHVEAGETFADAAVRELAEETGIIAGDLTQVGIYDAPDRDPRGRVITVASTALLDHAPTPTAGDDAATATWVRLTDALAGTLAFDHARILREALDVITGKIQQRTTVQRAFNHAVETAGTDHYRDAAPLNIGELREAIISATDLGGAYGQNISETRSVLLRAGDTYFPLAQVAVGFVAGRFSLILTPSPEPAA